MVDGDTPVTADSATPARDFPRRFRKHAHNGRVMSAPTHRYMTDRDKTWTEKGIEDSAEGKAKDLKGKIKDAAGSLTGDTSLEAEGKLDQLKGKAQDAKGKVERKIDKVGDAIDD